MTRVILKTRAGLIPYTKFNVEDDTITVDITEFFVEHVKNDVLYTYGITDRREDKNRTYWLTSNKDIDTVEKLVSHLEPSERIPNSDYYVCGKGKYYVVPLELIDTIDQLVFNICVSTTYNGKEAQSAVHLNKMNTPCVRV